MGNEPLAPIGGNLFADLPPCSDAESFDTILAGPGVRVERIVSRGQATPPDEWYNQDWDEWVMVLSGSAGLLIEGEPSVRPLGPGDYLLLPAHCRHRVAWTDPERETVWLAVHCAPPPME